MKKFNGKAIYNPAGKAGEYSPWACNFYVGCSNGCEYCYCKKGILKPVMGQDAPQLKKHFRNEHHAIEVLQTEIAKNLDELRKHGLFFSFTTDPMLPETRTLTLNAIQVCVNNGIPVIILTKCAEWAHNHCFDLMFPNREKIAVGFTLTGHDEKERGASTNAERITAMKTLHTAGFRTWASIEPIVDIPHSKLMIENSIGYCNHYKIGLMSGRKLPHKNVRAFVQWVLDGGVVGLQPKFYFKDSLLAQAGISRSELPNNCVGRDHNIFQA